MIQEPNFPIIYFTMSLIEVYGDISMSDPGLYYEARWIAAPDPIDLPNTKMSFLSIFFNSTM